MILPLVRKAVAYVTRPTAAGDELLVFDHRDRPDAGTQVPAGTVEPGESPDTAVTRELSEESGLSGLGPPYALGDVEYLAFGVRRFFYHLQAPSDLPDTWDWLTNDFHDEADRQNGRRLVFRFRWVRLSPVLTLAGDQHNLIRRLIETGRATPGEASRAAQ